MSSPLNSRLLMGAAILSVTAAPAFADEPAGKDGQVEKVVVTATRTKQSLLDVPASVSSQDVDDLRKNGFTYGTDEFRGVTGVFLRRGEGDGDEFSFVSIRGSTGTEGYLTLIDGIPFLGADEEPLLNQVPYDALERVEIVKGPVSALYGRGGLYGAVNYITRVPRADRDSVAVTAGSDGYYRGEGVMSRVFDGGSALVSASYEDYKGWRQQSGKEILNLFGRLTLDLSETVTLDLTANHFDRYSEVPNAIPTTPDGSIIPVFGGREQFLGYDKPLNDTRGTIGAAKLTVEASEGLTLSATAQVRYFDQVLRLNFYDPFGLDTSRNVIGFNGFVSDNDQTVYFGEAAAEYRLGRHTFVAGATIERATSKGLDSWSGQNGFTPACGFAFYLVEVDYTTGEIVNRDHPCFAVDEPLTQDDFTNTFWGAFIQDQIELSEHWRLIAGVRYDSFERQARVASPPSAPAQDLSGEASALSPKAALSYRYDGGQVYFAYGRGFNSNFGPTFEWDAAQFARPQNKPSTLDSYELGWKGRAFDDKVRFELAAFYTEQTNRRQTIANPDAATDFTAPANLITYGSLYASRGFEAAFIYQPDAATTFTIQYSWLDPEWKDYVVETFSGPVDLSGKTPTGVSQNIVYLAVDHALTPWFDVRASLEIYDDYMVTQINNIEAGGYENLNIGGTLALSEEKDVNLDLLVSNVLDEEYYFHFGGRSSATYVTPGTPRQFRATLRANF